MAHTRRYRFSGKDLEEISELKREGPSIQAISELAGYNRKTVGKYPLTPQEGGLRTQSIAGEQVEPSDRYLNQRLQAGLRNAQVPLHELRQRNYSGGYNGSDGLVATATAIGPRGGGAAIRNVHPANRHRQTGATSGRSA